ncbi:MAG: hypothetical protein HYT80_09895 [Euryarchaeota archaeon]|nr:hypothetical protein [Euryarchaeota archaeon]
MRSLALVLLLLGALLPTAHAQPSSAPGNELAKEDNAGDVGFRGSPTPPGTPGTPATDSYDLRNLRVHGEDLEGFHIEAKVQSIKRSPSNTWGSQRYILDFRLEGGTTTYQLEWAPVGYNQFGGNDTPTYGTRFCVRNQGDNFGCNRQRSLGGGDYAQNTLTAYIPKRSLMGLDPVGSGREAGALIHVAAGTALGQFSLRSSSDSGFFEDRLPDSGGVGPFILQKDAANGRVSVSLHKGNETKDDPYGYGQYNPYTEVGDFARVPAEPGNATRVELDIKNRNGGKRLLNLEASVDEASDKKQWDVRVAPSVQVPGNESRIVNLVVVAKDKIEHRDTALVRVIARSAGFPDEVGALTLRVVASAPVSVAHPTLFFHGAKQAGAVWDQALCLGPMPIGGCQDRLWMNTIEDDPTATADAAGFRTYGCFFCSTNLNTVTDYRFESDTKLSRDLVLDARSPVTANLKIRSGADGSAELGLRAGDKSLGQVSVSVKAGPAQDVPVSFLPLADSVRIPAGTPLRASVILRFPMQSQATAAPALIGKGSFLKLPAIVDPDATTAPPVALGDAFLSLTLKGDREEFMNPAKSKAYRLVLVNEGNLTDDARILANITDGGCGAAIRPGDEFRLEAGDSVRFDVLVRVPEGATEGSQCKTEVTAISGIDMAFKTRLVLTTIATTGAEFDDDAANYTTDEDARSKLRGNGSGSSTPGLGAAGTLVAAAGLVVVARRRLHP